MNIRAIRPEDSRLAVSRIYEESWLRDDPSKPHRITENMFTFTGEHKGSVTIQGDKELKK